MPATSVIGLQWGDEAKGKIVDLLAENHDIVVRYQGGNNAGHTVVIDGATFKLSMLPAGILRPGVESVVAGGVVINPAALLEELDEITSQNGGIEGGLLISSRAHVVFPWHIAEEAVLEARRGDDAIGTTMRGIGTCYRDKAGRTHAIRMCDLLVADRLKERIGQVIEHKNIVLGALDPQAVPLDAAAICDEYQGYADRLAEYVTDTTTHLHAALAQGKRVLFEGAQGALLDIDHGTFPYVTSSNSSAAGIHSGSGVPERAIERMIGVVKAYTTRVGGGPFPTELEDETGQHIRDEGNEYGTVTGRPRRCGWFDAVATGYGARLSGVDCLAVTLLDVLSKLEELFVCEEYEIDGERTGEFPDQIENLARARPVLRKLPGWCEDITGVRRLEDLPAAARDYLDTVSELIGVPVDIVSVGPDRDQTIVINSPS